jgi:glutathione S-transferase
LEAHDTHHPIASSLYYHDQKPEASRRAELFIQNRIPKYLGYFERVLETNAAGGGRHAVGSALSCVDLSLFQVMSGVGYAFPRALAKLAGKLPRLVALQEWVAAEPAVAVYLASPRRIAFNEHGIFRHYPELDS